MSTPTLEDRVSALEAEVNRLKTQPIAETSSEDALWWQRIRGIFKDDPDYEEAMRLGREYRESLRPQDDEASC